MPSSRRSTAAPSTPSSPTRSARTSPAIRSTTCFVVETPNPAPGRRAPCSPPGRGRSTTAARCEGTCTHAVVPRAVRRVAVPSLERSARRVEFLLGDRRGGGAEVPLQPGVRRTVVVHDARRRRAARHVSCGCIASGASPATTTSSASCGPRRCALSTTRCASGTTTATTPRRRAAQHVRHRVPRHRAARERPVPRGAARAERGWRRTSAKRSARRAGSTCADRTARGMEDVLWNGEYYRQVIEDVDAHRYQYGEGVLSDQLLGQFHAYVNGLGALLPERSCAERARGDHGAQLPRRPDHAREHAARLRPGRRGRAPARAPGRGRAPGHPVRVLRRGVDRASNTRSRHPSLYAGLPDQALELLERTLRDRYDGIARNPWNEIECGNHYARSLASWGLLLALQRARSRMPPPRTLAFDPVSDGRYLFTTDRAWGTSISGATDLESCTSTAACLDLDRLNSGADVGTVPLDDRRPATPTSTLHEETTT